MAKKFSETMDDILNDDYLDEEKDAPDFGSDAVEYDFNEDDLDTVLDEDPEDESEEAEEKPISDEELFADSDEPTDEEKAEMDKELEDEEEAYWNDPESFDNEPDEDSVPEYDTLADWTDAVYGESLEEINKQEKKLLESLRKVRAKKANLLRK